MYITAARYDELIPFEGVKMYVKTLQSCINHHKSIHPWRKVSESRVCQLMHVYYYNYCTTYIRRRQSVEEQYYLVLNTVMDITTAAMKKNIKRYNIMTLYWLHACFLSTKN